MMQIEEKPGRPYHPSDDEGVRNDGPEQREVMNSGKRKKQRNKSQGGQTAILKTEKQLSNRSKKSSKQKKHRLSESMGQMLVKRVTMKLDQQREEEEDDEEDGQERDLAQEQKQLYRSQ